MFVGYRGFLVREINGKPTLVSPAHHRAWAPGENTAQCNMCMLSMDENCTCGFYALKEPDPELVTYHPDIIGQVFLWGKVIEGERGVRAKKAMVSILLMPSIKVLNLEELEQLSIRYGAPLIKAKEPILHSISVVRKSRLISEGKLPEIAAMEQYKRDWGWMGKAPRRSGDKL